MQAEQNPPHTKRKEFLKMFKRFCLVTVTLILAALVATVVTGCSDSKQTDPIVLNSLPDVTEEVIPEGVFYLRCTEPEANMFSIQFVGAVPTRNVDYVGFEASEIYSDGTKSQRSTIRLYTLYNEITDEDTGLTITSEDFGIEDGYLYVRALDNIPTNQPDLAYEVLAYYVVGDQKYYTAGQVFNVQELLEEHILADPNPMEHEEESPLIDVQKWVKYTYDMTEDEDFDPAESDDLLFGSTQTKINYFLGSGVPDNNGNLSMYICFPVSELSNSSVGIRYCFTQTEGTNAGASTSVTQNRTSVLYDSVRSSSKTLRISDFGLSSGYIAVIEMRINTVLYSTFSLDFVAYTARNAIESVLISQEMPLSKIVDDTVSVTTALPVNTYTYIPQNYNLWELYSENNGNAEGDGAVLIRASRLIGSDPEAYTFDIQIAAAVPTRFVEELNCKFTMYDRYGNQKDEFTTPITVLYEEIFGNSDGKYTSDDLGVENGYILSLIMGGLSFNDTDCTYEITVTSETNGAEEVLTSLSVDAGSIIDTIDTN